MLQFNLFSEMTLLTEGQVWGGGRKETNGRKQNTLRAVRPWFLEDT